MNSVTSIQVIEVEQRVNWTVFQGFCLSVELISSFYLANQSAKKLDLCNLGKTGMHS